MEVSLRRALNVRIGRAMIHLPLVPTEHPSAPRSLIVVSSYPRARKWWGRPLRSTGLAKQVMTRSHDRPRIRSGTSMGECVQQAVRRYSWWSPPRCGMAYTEPSA